IIEFVPKSDSQVQKLLSSREDIFGEYDRQSFEREFGEFFTILRSEPIADTDRVLYLMTA
ncbi:MAG TPA: SAM-dependent methyltransferase, partial [Desulfobacterales bacterium]|nr:SAM-dependent methyltransferase [Desulfobacterales bacterium]